jgi:hypothetical protein
MLRRKHDGPVLTLADACEADYLVILKCGRCSREKQMHPYQLIGSHRRMTNAPLDRALAGFFCNLCRASVSVNITCTYTHPGGW